MRRPLLAAVVLLALAALLALVLAPSVPLPGPVDPARDFPLALRMRERAFHAAFRPLQYGGLALSLVVSAVLGLTPLGARLVTAAGRLAGGRWPAQVVLGTLAVTVVGTVLALPLSVPAEMVLRTYGLSVQGWGSWASDTAKGVLVAAVSAALPLLVLVGLARRTPRWWVAGAAVAAVLVVAGSYAYPLLVEPLFNRFTPLAAGPLRTELLGLAARDGVPVRDVLVADASRRTTELNAYVSGFGSTRRIVLYDTLLRGTPPRQVVWIVAHELGHAKRQDVLRGTAVGALGGAGAVCLLAALLQLRPLLRRCGAHGPGDPRVVALVLLLLAVGTLVADPGVNLISRRIEARADQHALELTGDPAADVAVQVRLAQSGLSSLAPPRLLQDWFGTHPTPPERTAAARAFRARQAPQARQTPQARR